MQDIERIFNTAVRDGTIPGAVLLAETQDGSFRYAKAFGVRNLESKAPMTLDTVMGIASCTKLLTTICLLQLFQSGKLTPETDALPYLPELASQKILKGFDSSGKPKLAERVASVITVRHLLTHSMGGSYTFIAPRLQRFYGSNAPDPATIVSQAGIPMIAEPGQIWSYSHGIDWAGLLLERVTGIDLDSYMRDYLWGPLGVSNDQMGFWPKNHPGLVKEKAHLSIRRDPEAPISHLAHDYLHDSSIDAFGGGGLYATMPAFMRILRSIIDPEDERVLNKTWKEEMFKPQIEQKVEDSLNKLLRNPEMAAGFVGETPTSRVRYSWGWGGLLSLDDEPEWRSKGTLSWSGLYNLVWYIDRKAGLCMVFGSQILPPGDPKTTELMSTFEKAVYAEMRSSKSKL